MSWLKKLFPSEPEQRPSAEAWVPKAEAYLKAVHAPARRPDIQFQTWSQPQTGSQGGSQAKYSMRDNYSEVDVRAAVISSMRDGSTDWALTSRYLGDLLDVSFVEQLREFIREKGCKDSAIYKAAQLDRRLFSKIVSDPDYRPAKDTCMAIALALELSLPQAEDLISRAGFTFSHSSKRDVILEFCFREKIYDVGMVNDLLFRLGEKTLGRY